jgi:transcriptional regulator with XRE-family HTH domain
METIDIIKQLCSKKGISLSQLESDLGYGNGSVGKSKNMSADRMYQIANYFGVSMEYLITGKTLDETDNEMSILRQQQAIMMAINKTTEHMTDLYKEIAECQDQLSSLKREYNKIELSKKNSVISAPAEVQEQAPANNTVQPEGLPFLFFNDELPFK